MARTGIGKAGMTMMRRCFLCDAAMLGMSERTLTYPEGLTDKALRDPRTLTVIASGATQSSAAERLRMERFPGLLHSARTDEGDLRPSRRDSEGLRRFPLACGSCGVLLDREANPAACRDHLARSLDAPVFVSDPDAPYGLDLYTLRSAATRSGLGVRPLDAEGEAALRRPHDARAARAAVFRLEGDDTRPVSLGLICRPEDREALLTALPAQAGWTDDVVLLLDDAPFPPETVPLEGFPPGAVRVASRPLNGDFAAQRNALQDLARHGWMLQLDADETLDPATGSLLPALAALAEAGGVVSVGLARRNRVDGVMSDVFPDVQYRLNRTEVRYAGRVHERPVLDGGWPRSLIALHGAIEHHLSSAHVRARSRRYEALDPGRGRPEEEDALLTPFSE